MLLGKVVVMPILCWLGLCKDIYEDASSPSMHFFATSMVMVPPQLLKACLQHLPPNLQYATW